MRKFEFYFPTIYAFMFQAATMTFSRAHTHASTYMEPGGGDVHSEGME